MADILKRSASFYIKRISGLILLLILAAVFFFSAISKLYSVETFEWTFMDMGINNMTIASVIAHLFIGLEFVIGAFLLFHIYLKQVTYPATIAMLLILTGYLVILVIQQGNNGSCGCFGDWLYMKPMAAIWKNIAMIAAVVLLIYIYPIRPYKNQESVAALLGMVALVVPFIIAPMNVSNRPESVNQPIDLTPLYADSVKPATELRTGKHIVAFMSLTCPHCRKAAYLLQSISRNNPSLPIYLVLSGNPDNEAEFYKETHSAALPHILMRNAEGFISMAGASVPAIYWINNSVVEKKSNYYQLNPGTMIEWSGK